MPGLIAASCAVRRRSLRQISTRRFATEIGVRRSAALRAAPLAVRAIARLREWREACCLVHHKRRQAMKSIRDMFAALIVAGAALTAPVMTGCYATGEATVVDEGPPPLREEVVVARPGFIWVHGHWTRPGGHWVWRGGYYERERPNQVYVEGRWERRGRGHVWVEGGWRARANVTVREHD
jgi:hypothetical protein